MLGELNGHAKAPPAVAVLWDHAKQAAHVHVDPFFVSIDLAIAVLGMGMAHLESQRRVLAAQKAQEQMHEAMATQALAQNLKLR